ncbi:peptidoglycan-binding protein [Streptomyces flavofungini]|uniref:peptidoglycan-binding protein n=1 Tax=Streptomyces flavofungini TaxID=68200 RepID=UPI0025AF7AE2|nr:peptidoglycan-binding protein [Streptomyces flavofungini]WJV49908.1 peptidoglycan-binding protein [Streptomyces flavofungini]
MTPAQIKAQLRKFDVPFKEYRSWETHNRNHKGAWGPVNGFMVHHTGSDSRDQRALLYGGIAGLPGPLCHFGLAQDGTVHLVGWGRANHAGSGDPDVLRAVQNESYGKNPPADNQSTVDGNARFYGVEIWYSGSHQMTGPQYKTLLRLAAAVCDFHGWSEKSVIGHGEWGSPGKWDPGYKPGRMMDMAEVRSDVKTVLKPGGKPPTKPDKPKPPTKPKPGPGPFPGTAYFRPGASNKYVTMLGKQLVKRGYGRFYKVGPGPTWTSVDRAAVRAFQKAQGWSGSDADGYPGRETWRRLFA